MDLTCYENNGDDTPKSFTLTHILAVVGPSDFEFHRPVVRRSIICGPEWLFTHEALATVFPLTLWDLIVWNRLIGRELVCPMLLHMHFNTKGKLVRHDLETDFFAAIDRVLQDSPMMAMIMGSAIVAEESMVGEINSSHDQPLVGEVCTPRKNTSTERDQTPEVDSDDESLSPLPDDSSRHAISFLLS